MRESERGASARQRAAEERIEALRGELQASQQQQHTAPPQPQAAHESDRISALEASLIHMTSQMQAMTMAMSKSGTGVSQRTKGRSPKPTGGRTRGNADHPETTAPTCACGQPRAPDAAFCYKCGRKHMPSTSPSRPPKQPVSHILSARDSSPGGSGGSPSDSDSYSYDEESEEEEDDDWYDCPLGPDEGDDPAYCTNCGTPLQPGPGNNFCPPCAAPRPASTSKERNDGPSSCGRHTGCTPPISLQ